MPSLNKSFEKFDAVAAEDKIVAEVLSSKEAMATLVDLDVMKTYQNLARGDLSPDRETIHIFWANNYDVVNKKHHGHDNALKHVSDAAHSGKPVLLLEHYEGKEVPELMKVEASDVIPQNAKDFMYACSSRNFASEANDEVRTSVQGASPYSFFRTTELYVVMNNPAINTITILTEGEDGKVTTQSMPKQEAYHALRDEWIDSSIAKHEKAAQEKRNAQKELRKVKAKLLSEKDESKREKISTRLDEAKNKLDTAEKLLESSEKVLATEYAVSRHTLHQEQPFSKGGLYQESPKYSEEDKKKETARLWRFNKAASKSPHLTELFHARYEEYNPNQMTTSDKAIYTMDKLSEQLSEGEKKDLRSNLNPYLHAKARETGAETTKETFQRVAHDVGKMSIAAEAMKEAAAAKAEAMKGGLESRSTGNTHMSKQEPEKLLEKEKKPQTQKDKPMVPKKPKAAAITF